MPNLIVRHRLRIRNRTTHQWDDIPAINSYGGSAWGPSAIAMLISILRDGTYTRPQTGKIDALEAILTGGGGTDPDPGPEPGGVEISYSGLVATITGLATTNIAYNGENAEIGG